MAEYLPDHVGLGLVPSRCRCRGASPRPTHDGCRVWLAILALTLVAGACSWSGQTDFDYSGPQPEANPTPVAAALSEASPTPTLTPAQSWTPTPTPEPTSTPAPTVSPWAPAARLRFTAPIAGAHVPEWLDLMPGAPRDYRSGIHEGVDFAYGAVGVPVRLGTRVVAAGDGVVVRADVDYREPSPKEMVAALALSRALGHTPPDVLDQLRGRQVWIDHGGGVVTRYAHLSGVAPGVAPGLRVSRGQLIAYVGESGVPDASEGMDVGPHLHFEIRLGEGYLGQGLSREEARQLYVQALGGGN